MPTRPDEGNFENGKLCQVLLNFYNNGGVASILFLTPMNEYESLASLSAFRKWQIEPAAEGISQMFLLLTYTFSSDEDEAILIEEKITPYAVTPPVAVKSPPPSFPLRLRREHLSGMAALGFIVDKDGRARNIEVLYTTHPDCSENAVKALAKWKFEPATVNGNPVNARTYSTFPFIYPK